MVHDVAEGLRLGALESRGEKGDPGGHLRADLLVLLISQQLPCQRVPKDRAWVLLRVVGPCEQADKGGHAGLLHVSSPHMFLTPGTISGQDLKFWPFCGNIDLKKG